MAVVSSLGERYLWVDVLCIIQDDEKSKALFISQMDIVYHHALLTIVAMSGQDANSGLPGLRPFTRPQQLCKEVDGSVFLATLPGLRSSASASRYEQRGWTLQERILSKRCLYFSAGETYYQCRSAVWQEPSLAQELVGARPMFEPPTLMNPLKISPTGSLLNAEDAYQRLVERYTRRCLTFPSDKLNAFRGILGLLSDNDGSTWEKSGVPASFLSSLLWAPVTTVIRRPTSVTPGEDPPTWSWLAWDGPVNFPVRGTIDCRGSTHALHSLRIKFESRVQANRFQITGGQIDDANKEAVPGTLLRDIHGQIAGVLFDFEEKFTAIWGKLWVVYHSSIFDRPRRSPGEDPSQPSAKRAEHPARGEFTNTGSNNVKSYPFDAAHGHKGVPATAPAGLTRVGRERKMIQVKDARAAG